VLKKMCKSVMPKRVSCFCSSVGHVCGWAVCLNLNKRRLLLCTYRHYYVFNRQLRHNDFGSYIRPSVCPSAFCPLTFILHDTIS